MAEEKLGKDTPIPKKERSALSLVGFYISVIAIVLAVVIILVSAVIFRDLSAGLWFGGVLAAIPCSILFLIALILSIPGLVLSLKKKPGGIGFSIAGVVSSVLGGVVSIYLLSGILSAVNNLGPFFYSDSYSGSEIQYDDYEVKLKSDSGKGSSEATLLTYYWSGDPEDVIIRPDTVNNGETKITSIGYYDRKSDCGANFMVALPDEIRFTGYDPYIGSKIEENLDENLKEHLGKFGIEPGTKVIFDELEFHVIITPEIENVVVSREYPVYRKFLAMKNDDGSITLYRYYLFFECSEDNEHFYADENGRLKKKNEEGGFVSTVSLYRRNDGYEPFEMVYEGE